MALENTSEPHVEIPAAEVVIAEVQTTVKPVIEDGVETEQSTASTAHP